MVSLSAIAEESDRPRGRTIGLVGLSIGPTHAYCSRAMVLLYLGRVASLPPCRLLSFVYFLFCVTAMGDLMLWGFIRWGESRAHDVASWLTN